MANQILAEISLRDYSKLVFSVGEWRGRQLASVRKFVTTQKYEGPTKAGLALASRLLSDLIVVLEELENSLPPKEEHEFGRITKSRTAYVRIATLPSGDEEVLPEVDVREFVDSATYAGPTKRGIRFRWDLVPEVLACLRQQANLVRENEAREPTLFGNGAPCPAGEESNLTRRSPRVDAVAEILSERTPPCDLS